MSLVMELKHRKLLLIGEQGCRVVIPPKGVRWDAERERFTSVILRPDGTWVNKHSSTKDSDVIDAYYNAIEARQRSIGVLLSRRAMRCIIRPHVPPTKSGDGYVVTDPFDKKVHRLKSEEDARSLRDVFAERWIATHLWKDEDLY